MQLWLRTFRKAFRHNLLCDEQETIAESGLELHVKFEKGDRLKWIDQLANEAFRQSVHGKMSVKQVVITCNNSDLFERNWAQHEFGDNCEQNETLASLYLSSIAYNMGIPLQWLIDEWQSLYPPRPYHSGLLKKYQRLIKQVHNQMLYRGLSKVYFRDPLLATCTDLSFEYGNSDFFHLDSEQIIHPAWMRLGNTMEENTIAFA